MSYITLMSNASSILPGGKVADFRTRLEKPLYLDKGSWEIGVYRLYVPRCFDILSSQDFILGLSVSPRPTEKFHFRPKSNSRSEFQSSLKNNEYLKISDNDTLTSK